MRWAVLPNQKNSNIVREIVESWFEEYEGTTDPDIKRILDPFGFFRDEFVTEYEDFVNLKLKSMFDHIEKLIMVGFRKELVHYKLKM